MRPTREETEARASLPEWNPRRETRCSNCGDTGWVVVRVGESEGVKPCPNCRKSSPADRQKLSAGERE